MARPLRRENAQEAKIRREFGQIDVLVNNAGIAGADKPTDELSEEEWDKVMAINVKGDFLCTKHVIHQLREAGSGSIMKHPLGHVGEPDDIACGILYLASEEAEIYHRQRACH